MSDTQRPSQIRLAIGIELLPLLVIPLRLIALRFDASWISAIAVPLIFVTGIGWAMVGRWRAGIAVALIRLAVLALAYGAWVLASLSNLDVSCNRGCGPSTLDYITPRILIATLVVTTLGSAWWLAWGSWLNRSPQGDASAGRA